MFSLYRQQEIEKEVAAIDLQISEVEPYQFQRKGNLRERKGQLLQQLAQCKGKEKQIYEASVSYSPTELYQSYPEGHKDRQSFRRDREAKLRLQIKEEQDKPRKLCRKVEDLKSEVKML